MDADERAFLLGLREALVDTIRGSDVIGYLSQEEATTLLNEVLTTLRDVGDPPSMYRTIPALIKLDDDEEDDD